MILSFFTKVIALFLSLLFVLLSPLNADGDKKITNISKNSEPHLRAAANFVDLGNKSYERGNYKEAQDQYFRALIYDPTYGEAHLGLAQTYMKLSLTNDAIREYNSALVFNPGYTMAYLQLANIYLSQKKTNLAFDVYFKALSLNPLFSITNPKDIHISLRRKNEVDTLEKNIKEDTLKGKKVFIYSDVDVASTLLFSRYLTFLKEKGANVLFEPPRVLEDIFKVSLEDIEIIDWLTLQEDITYDYKAPLGSLAYLFGGVKEPQFILKAPKKDDEQFRGWILKDSNTLGIAWKPQGELSFFSNLTQSFTIYSLQSQTTDLDISELIDDFDSLSNLSGAIANLDIVLSFNNTIAILAASLGKPTWLILGDSTEWMWQGAEQETPWFKNMRLFHNPKPEDILDELKKVYINKNTKQ